MDSPGYWVLVLGNRVEVQKKEEVVVECNIKKGRCNVEVNIFGFLR